MKNELIGETHKDEVVLTLEELLQEPYIIKNGPDGAPIEPVAPGSETFLAASPLDLDLTHLD